MHNERVNKCSLAIAGMVIVLLITTFTSGSIMSASASAKHSGDVRQAASISNSCLNPVSSSNTNDNMISNGNCGGTVSQQGKSGQASTPTTVQNANPAVEVQRSTTTQPPITGPRPETCTQCFDMLNATQQQAINQTLAGDPNILESIVWPAGITTLEELCKAWDQFTSAQRSDALADIGSLIQQTPLDSATRHKLFTCFVVSAGQ